MEWELNMYKQDAKFIAPPKTFTPDLKGLVEWLETQDPETEYNWSLGQTCVVGCFLKAINHPEYPLGACYSDGMDGWNTLRFQSNDDYMAVTHTRPWTYGAALKRARALLK